MVSWEWGRSDMAELVGMGGCDGVGIGKGVGGLGHEPGGDECRILVSIMSKDMGSGGC